MAEIKAKNGQIILVDDKDFEELNRWGWYVIKPNNIEYAIRNESWDSSAIYMHRELMPTAEKFVVDHVNGNGLDNRRENLRSISHVDNLRRSYTKRGSSKFKGVSWFKPANKWRARIHISGKEKSLGYFKNEVDAAKAYDITAKNLLGGLTYLNFG